MKRIIIFLILCSINVFPFYSQEIDSFELDRYRWRKAKTGEFVFIEPANKNISETWYKILSHCSGNEFVTFNIFPFKDNDKPFDRVPLYGFEKMSFYIKLDKSEGLQGRYRATSSLDIDYFEIKEITEKQFIYKIDLPDFTCGEHLLYLKDGKLRSDSTFGIWKNFFFDELIKVDRSESFYIANNFQNKLDDRFSISVTDYDDVYKKLTVITENGNYDIYPNEFFLEEGEDCLLRGKKLLYSKADFNSPLDTTLKTQTVMILRKEKEWIFDDNLYTIWVKIKLPDSRIVWVTGKSLYKELK